MSEWIATHWLDWTTLAIAGAAGWLIANAVAAPLLQFWADRRSAIQVLRIHGSVGWLASEESVNAAHTAVRDTAATIMFYAEAGPGIVRLYCKIRGYDLRLAGLTLNGVHARIGTNTSDDNLLQCDAVRLCLGATKSMTQARRFALRKMLDEAASDDQ